MEDGTRMDGVIARNTATEELEEFAEVVDAAAEAFAAERACWRRMVALHLDAWRRSGRPDHAALLLVPGRHMDAIAGELEACGYTCSVSPNETENGGRVFLAWRLEEEPRLLAGVIRFAAAAGIPFEG